MVLERRPAGQTGLTLSRLGFGCSAFWATPHFEAAAAIRLVHQAADLGVTYFDTGASYGAGEAERRLGEALKQLKNSGDVIVSTKAGTHVGEKGVFKDFSPAAIRASVEGSLSRLGRERIDILYLHGPQLGNLTPETLETLKEIKKDGLVRAFGVNSFDPSVLLACAEIPLDGVMLEYNVLNQSSLSIANTLYEQGKFVVCGTPIAQSLFSGNIFRPTSRSRIWYLLRALVKHRRNLIKARKLAFLNHHEKYSAAQLAIAFVVRHQCFSSAVFGTTRVEHLEQNINAANLVLDQETIDRIESVG